MNLIPEPGDRWTRPGEPDLTVLSVKSGKVTLSRGGTIPLTQYLELAAATIRNGGSLHRTETEDPYFE